MFIFNKCEKIMLFLVFHFFYHVFKKKKKKSKMNFVLKKTSLWSDF